MIWFGMACLSFENGMAFFYFSYSSKCLQTVRSRPGALARLIQQHGGKNVES